MFPQDVLDCVASYSLRPAYGHWLKCSETVINENKVKVLKAFKHGVQDVLDSISYGISFVCSTEDWRSFIANPNNGLHFHIVLDLCYLTFYNYDSDDEDNWAADAFLHLDKFKEWGEDAIGKLRQVLNDEKIRYNLETDADYLGGSLLVFYGTRKS
jgi:hypothetical protein